jgi:predicted ribosome quality control (RQC) complex YloA/Tae2 family protein
MVTIYADNYIINIGKNAKDNWNILETANGNDIWLHLNNFPSPYVLITCKENYKLKSKDIRLAGRLCREHSKEKKTRNIEICYLKVEYVKKGKHLGEALLLKEPKIMNIK